MTDCKKFIKFLTDRAWITQRQAADIRQRCNNMANIGKILTTTPLITQKKVNELLAEYKTLDADPLASMQTDLREIFPYNILLRFHIAPLSGEGGIIRVATSRPLESDELIELQKIASKPVEMVIVSKEEVNDALDNLFSA